MSELTLLRATKPAVKRKRERQWIEEKDFLRLALITSQPIEIIEDNDIFQLRDFQCKYRKTSITVMTSKGLQPVFTPYLT